MNIKFSSLLLLVGFIGFEAIAQVDYKKHEFSITRVGTVDPKEIHEEFAPRVTHLEAPNPNGDSYKSFLLRAKARLAEQYPVKEAYNSGERASAQAPLLVSSWGLSYPTPNGAVEHQGGTPNDNSFAVSNDGYLLTAWNSFIYAHDLNADTSMFRPNQYFNAISFKAWAGSSIQVADNFDPKILFDPLSNRFVMLFLSVDRTTPTTRNQTSKTVIGFSSSSNPLDPWNMYEISGNPLNNNTWSDYPAIALNKDELFFTINLLTGGDWINDFQRTVIWQIDKNSGYRGDTALTTHLWDSVSYNGKFLRYFRPIQHGAGPAGDNMYFISNQGIPVDWGDTTIHSSDSIFLIEVDNTIASGSAKLTVKPGKANQRYHTPPDARQADNHTLFSNDARVLGGFYNNGQIQFVGTTRDTTTNRTGVYHGIITNLNGPINVDMHTIGDDSVDIGFPNIAYTGIKSAAQSSIISFDHSSPTQFAGNACVYYDGQGNYSPVKIVKTGDNYVDLLSWGGNRLYERWGDYFGTQRVFNDPKHVWMAGYYGRSDRRPGIWMSKVKAPNDVNDPDTVGQGPPAGIEEKAGSTISLFPNPIESEFSIQFNSPATQQIQFVVMDINGRIVQELLSTTVKEGQNEFRFVHLDLNPGVYFVRASSKAEILFNEKLVKSSY